MFICCNSNLEIELVKRFKIALASLLNLQVHVTKFMDDNGIYRVPEVIHSTSNNEIYTWHSKNANQIQRFVATVTQLPGNYQLQNEEINLVNDFQTLNCVNNAL